MTRTQARKPTDAPVPSGVLRRKCACGGKCSSCKTDEDGELRRKATGRAPGEVPAVVYDVLREPGSPLDAGTRAFFEPRFGADFSDVRVHTGGRAAESAEAVSAAAYTVGRDVVFGPGGAGDAGLLAHELTHVAQQGGPVRPGIRLRLDDPSAAAETEAVAAERMPGSAAAAPAGVVYRKSKNSGTQPDRCGGPWTCSTSANCAVADNAIIGPMPPSTWWKLTVMIDIEATSAARMRESTTGHAYVRFEESNGLVYTYGFYPNPSQPPNIFRTSTNGCVVHPDTSHLKCIDYQEQFDLTEKEYRGALDRAQLFCQGVPKYDLRTFNCTTFTGKVVEAAGKSLPSMSGEVGSGTFSTTADNPNTLIDNLRARDAARPGQ